MTFDWMWVWWVGTVALAGGKLIEGLWRPARMLEWPFLASAMWIYFYGYMAFEAKRNLSAYLGNGMSNIGQLMPFLCLIALLAGWSVGKRAPVRPPARPREYSYALAWSLGFPMLLLGAAGAYSVVQAVDEGNLNFRATSAYWYLLFYVGYPGLAIAIWAVLKMKSLPVQIFLGALTLLALIAFMIPPILNARRGPLFPAALILLLVPPLTLRRPPNRLLYCGGLAAVAVVALVFLQIRTVTYNGGTWKQAFQVVNLGAAITERGEEAEDNEYVNNCQQIGTIFQNGKYQYGTGHLELLVHWVPRQLWWEKPALGEGYYSFDEMNDDIEMATGVRLLGHGAASAGVADSFVQYGLLCPLWWFALACGLGAVYAQAIHGRRPLWMFVYIGFICASHWLISQNFAAAFVPAMYFEAVPLFVFFLLWLYEQATAAPQKVRHSRPALINKPRAPLPVHGS
jgi:hypothetical protein